MITAIDGNDVTGCRCYLVGHLLHTKTGTNIAVTLGRGDRATLIATTK